LGEFSPIGSLFTFGQFYKIYTKWPHFSTVKVAHKFLEKGMLGHILSDFSQTHPVTLAKVGKHF
jgi:hypothetical protein